MRDATPKDYERWIKRFLKPGAKVKVTPPTMDVEITMGDESIGFTEIGDDMSHISINYSKAKNRKYRR